MRKKGGFLGTLVAGIDAPFLANVLGAGCKEGFFVPILDLEEGLLHPECYAGAVLERDWSCLEAVETSLMNKDFEGLEFHSDIQGFHDMYSMNTE